MTSSQWSQWQAWWRVRGLPQERADYRSGQICAVIANVNRSSNTAKAFAASDFVMSLPELEEDETPEEVAEDEVDPMGIEARSRALAAMLGRK